MTKTRGIRVSQDLDREIATEAEAHGTSWSAMSQQLLAEAIRMRRAPGVVFVDGATGRRAVVAGTGLDVWEVIATWKECDGDYEKLRQSYSWLTEPQLRAAIGYYQLYPKEIETRLEREQSWTEDRVRRELPFAVARNPPPAGR
ncbi:MAG: hypothetical protein GY719_21260 [bacterium]|nr:hypothetical protein [bacterium]